MTDLARKINKEINANQNVTAKDIFNKGIGNSVNEVEFIMEQIKLFK